MANPRKVPFFLAIGLLSVALPGICGGADLTGSDAGLLRSPEMPSEMSSGVVAGKVTDAVSGAGIGDVVVRFEPTVAETHLSTDLHPILSKASFSTDANGFYYAKIPAGPYRLTFARPRYNHAERAIVVLADKKVPGDVVLEPIAPVVVYAGKEVTGIAPGSTVRLKASITIRDDSTLKRIDWRLKEKGEQVPAVVTARNEGSAAVTIPDPAAYKTALLDRLGRQGRLLDRWMVLGLGPSDLQEAGKTTLEAQAETSSGTYRDAVDIVADIRSFAAVNPGLQNVPVGTPVLLQGKDQPSYQWSLSGPRGFKATLDDASTQNPYFSPDLPGTYTVAEGGKTRLTIYAGRWIGAIAARDVNRPWMGRNGCSCHGSDRIAPKFGTWWNSGHAQIFSRNITMSYRYEESCFACHSVGFGGASSGGIKDDPAYRTFLKDERLWDLGKVPPIVKPAPGNMDYILTTYPGVAKLANAQCESCHGPSDSQAHRTLKDTGAPERISLSADVCGRCHDPFADVSYRQLQESTHGNYNLAREVATVEKRADTAGNCARCHAGQGFLAWTARQKRTAVLQGKGGNATAEEMNALGLTIDRVQPITCAICHNPHDPGNSFRANAEKVPTRISGDSRMHPAEFGAHDGGRGAICIVCHSTGSGPANDVETPVLIGDAAPHAPQADVLMGQNAFFVQTGRNRSHSLIEDTCIWCHMKPVPKKSTGGYPRGGVNHTFKPSPGICSRCHKEFDGDELMVPVEGDLQRLKSAIETAIMAEIKRNMAVTLVKGANDKDDVVLNASDLRRLDLIELRGNIAFAVTTGQTVYDTPLSRMSLGRSPLVPTPNGQIMAKAAWNYFLLKRGSSRGAHNPQFVSEVLEATMTKLKALTP
jgi:hypothetical protein